MKTQLRSLLALLALAPAALLAADQPKNCGCACCKGKEVCCCHEKESAAPADSTAPAKAEVRHKLKGIVVDIRAADSALLVKHEPIAGFMPAMTMLFKVDAATLAAAKKGTAIAATLVERDGDFWLLEVHPAHP